MIAKEQIAAIVQAYIPEGSPYFLVEVKVEAGNRIVVSIDSDETVDVNYCAELSRHIEAQLDRETEDFELEVGSAGLTSPLLSVRRWRKCTGADIELLLKRGEKLRGRLVSADETGVRVSIPRRIKPEGAKRPINTETEEDFAYEDIKQAVRIIKI